MRETGGDVKDGGGWVTGRVKSSGYRAKGTDGSCRAVIAKAATATGERLALFGASIRRSLHLGRRWITRTLPILTGGINVATSEREHVVRSSNRAKRDEPLATLGFPIHWVSLKTQTRLKLSPRPHTNGCIRPSGSNMGEKKARLTLRRGRDRIDGFLDRRCQAWY